VSTHTRRILSRNLRELRLRHGWSQEQLAAQCDLHRTYIGAVERGERNLGIDNLERLARALHTSPAAMLEETAWTAADHQVRESPGARYATDRAATYSWQLATHSLSTAVPG
jgi:transcriptional regulator with XRE-family HTH domain